ncbi:phosphotransferase family protein [Nocardioides pacificus]
MTDAAQPPRDGSTEPSTDGALDEATLTAYLDEHRPGLLLGSLRSELIAGGRSNLTYRLSDGTRTWVLRRPPLGHVLATAHDVGREYLVMSALAGSPVPVPGMVVHCADASVIGAPFYVMDFADGEILRSAGQLDAITPQRGRALATALADTLADLHELDPASVGLGDLGRPVGYNERQVRRWVKQVEASTSRDLPGLDRLVTRLLAGVPGGQAAIVHGDYRLDNVVLGPDDRVAAVLDWEMATLGDPLTDVATMAVWWDGIAGLDSPVAAVPGEHAGFPASTVLLERYAARRASPVGDLSWYLAFASFKIAAICEGIHYRHTQGLTVGDGFDRIGGLVVPMIERAHTALDASGERIG